MVKCIRTAGTALSLTFFLFFLSSSAWAQLTLLVESYPANTPKNDSIYIVGSFNDWSPKDPNYLLLPQPDGTLLLKLPFRGDFDYKFTRGTWNSVEASFNGEAIGNRQFRAAQSQSDTIRVNIVNWEDIPPHSNQAFATVTFILDEVPANTPKDASIYIVGNFNDWHPGAPAYKLHKMSNGLFSIDLPIWLDKFEYKFTRGDWPSVEARRNGQARQNRTYEYVPDFTEVHVSIEAWEDLDGSFFSLYTFILIFAAVQGILLMLAINRLQNNNRRANNILSLLILMISIALLARVSTYSREAFQWQPKLLLIPDFIFFTYGPVFLSYIQKLLTLKPKPLRQRWVQFIPAISHFLAYLPLFFMDKDTFITKVVDRELHLIFAIAGVLALAFNAYYWWRCVVVINHYRRADSSQHSFEESNVTYLDTVMNLKGVCLAVWTFALVVSMLGEFTELEMTWLVEVSTDAVWIVFSSITYFLGYFAMSQPEIFKHPAQEMEEEKNVEVKQPAASPPKIPSSELLPLKKELTKLMEHEKPYLNPKLTLGELASMIHTNTHTLSRVINEGFGRNFFDFVNSYRVEAFKQKIAEGAHKQQTLLGIAMEVGFNSKTAFNRAFKKMTDTTPGKYLKSLEDTQP